MKTKPDHKSIAKQAMQFIKLKNASDLSCLLTYYFQDFKTIIENASYREFKIPKSKGGYRTIEAPNEDLMVLQKRLNTYLQALYCMIKPEAAFGFVLSYKEEKNPHTIITNAQQHLNKHYVLNIDLKDFFHTVSATQVKQFFLNSPFCFTEDLAICIALICCYNKRLPMGAATSPVVSNLFCIPLDRQLMGLAADYNFTYTRYADDITLSSDSEITKEAIEKVKHLITQNGFIINEKKYRLQSKYRQQTVTGIKVNTKTNLDRRYIRNIRAALHDIKLNGLHNATMKHFKIKQADEKLIQTFLLSLSGKINFIGQVKGKEDGVYKKLKEMGESCGIYVVISKVLVL